MSTHPPTTSATSRETRPTDPSALLTGERRATDGWVARCQRQFDPRCEKRLRNLADDENAATPDPGEPVEI